MRLAAFLEQRKRPAVLLRWDAVVNGPHIFATAFVAVLIACTIIAYFLVKGDSVLHCV